jgi:hypothetical protein
MRTHDRSAAQRTRLGGVSCNECQSVPSTRRAPGRHVAEPLPTVHQALREKGMDKQDELLVMETPVIEGVFGRIERRMQEGQDEPRSSV